MESMQSLKIMMMSAVTLCSLLVQTAQGEVSPLQRPAVDVAWFRSEDWSLEVACSVNGCSANNSIVRPGEKGFYTTLYTEQLKPEDCAINIQKQETHCLADGIQVLFDFETYANASLSISKVDDIAIIEAIDGFGNVIYSNRKNVPFEGCAFHVSENGAYVGTFGSRRFQPFETIILADGTNKSACDNRAVEKPQPITGVLKGREIQCVSREFSLSLNVGAPFVDLGNGGGPYYLFKQNIVFEVRARTGAAATQLGLVAGKSVDVFTMNTTQSKRAFYEDSVGISVLEASPSGDPFLIQPSMWTGIFSGENLPVIFDANSDGSYFRLRLQNAHEGLEQYHTEIKFPLQNCTATQEP